MMPSKTLRALSQIRFIFASVILHTHTLTLRLFKTIPFVFVVRYSIDVLRSFTWFDFVLIYRVGSLVVIESFKLAWPNAVTLHMNALTVTWIGPWQNHLNYRSVTKITLHTLCCVTGPWYSRHRFVSRSRDSSHGVSTVALSPNIYYAAGWAQPTWTHSRGH